MQNAERRVQNERLRYSSEKVTDTQKGPKKTVLFCVENYSAAVTVNTWFLAASFTSCVTELSSFTVR